MNHRCSRAMLWLMPAAVWFAAAVTGLPQTLPIFDSPRPASQSQQVESPLAQLSWANEHQFGKPKPTDATADFTFAFTNISDTEIVIDHVKPSCSCTAAKLPSQPWHLPPHTNGAINVSVNLKGKEGTFDKTITVFFGATNVRPKVLTVTVQMPDRNKMRSDNMKIAQADRQAVFKGDCAQCHAEPAKHYTGMALYHEICGVCHEAHPRASMIPDLRLIMQPPTDFTFWKTNIAYGKRGTLMPAFAKSEGGPLTDEQIDELARTIDSAYPYARFAHRNPPIQTAPANKGQRVSAASPVQKN